jgi:hypothetical protein
MDAEVIYDAILKVSGRLDVRMWGEPDEIEVQCRERGAGQTRQERKVPTKHLPA